MSRLFWGKSDWALLYMSIGVLSVKLLKSLTKDLETLLHTRQFKIIHKFIETPTAMSIPSIGSRSHSKQFLLGTALGTFQC